MKKCLGIQVFGCIGSVDSLACVRESSGMGQSVCGVSHVVFYEHPV